LRPEGLHKPNPGRNPMAVAMAACLFVAGEIRRVELKR
jgi:hypothetical protein